MFFISAKFKRLAIIYSLAAIAALGGVAAMCWSRLSYYRLAADYSAASAFDETVSAVESLSVSLKKLGYVTDDVLCRSICSRAYADAMSAESAMSVLPFSTQELEKLSGFLNLAGDYAASLLSRAEEELGDEQRQQLQQLSEAAADFSARLRQLQSEVNDGSLLMDSMEGSAQSGGAEFLSARLLSYESEFSSPEEFVYDGKYSPAAPEEAGELSEEEAKQLAAEAAGVEARELKEEYSYEGDMGRRCYSAGELMLCVSSRGLESMSQSRLISSGGVDTEQSRQSAEEFLQKLGYESLGLSREDISETLASYRYAPEQDGALREDDYISISVALDDGSIYAFDATRYSAERAELQWKTDEEAARKTLPEGLEASSVRKVIIKSPGGSYIGCWELLCEDPEGGSVKLYVDAATGRQCRIELTSRL